MDDTLIEGNWCHVVWQTADRRAVFKVAEHATFCERLLTEACRARGWQVEAVAVNPDTLQALVRITASTRLERRTRSLLGRVARGLRTARIGPSWPRRLWRRTGWCVLIGSPGAASRIRRHLLQLRSAPDR